MNKLTVVFVVFVLGIMLIGCSQSQPQSSQPADSLKVGIMPAVDSVPILVAKTEGYFKEVGLDIEVQIYTNAVNRQSALQTGELDGAITDLVALVNNVQNGFNIKATLSTDGSFPVLVNQNFTEQKEVKAGMMEVSVTNFLAEEYLANDYKLNKVFISKIPARLEMVKAGKLDMAVIPEPMASMGQLQGLEKRVYKPEDKFTPGAVIFTEQAIKEKKTAINGFHQAYNQAVEKIETNPELAREVLINKLELKPAVKDLIAVPEYHQTRIADKEYMTKIINWIERVEGTKINVEYKDLITEEFLQ